MGLSYDGFHLHKVATGFLDPYDIRTSFAERPDCRGLDINSGPSLDVVQDAGDVHTVCYRLEVQVQPFLCRLVIVRVYQQHRIGADLLGVPGEAYGLTGGVRAGSRNDRDPAISEFDGKGDDPVVLIVAEGRTSSCVPQGTRPDTPLAICVSTICCSNSSSKKSFLVKGVTIAVDTPLKLISFTIHAPLKIRLRAWHPGCKILFCHRLSTMQP